MNIPVPVGFAQITDLTAAVALTLPAGADSVLLQAEGVALRWRDDGVAPTATVGMNLAAGTELFYVGEVDELVFIETAAGGILNASFYQRQ